MSSIGGGGGGGGNDGGGNCNVPSPDNFFVMVGNFDFLIWPKIII